MTSDAAAAPAAPGILSPALAERVGYLLAQVHIVARGLADEALGSLGVNIKQYGILTILRAEGPLSQQAVGVRIGCDRTTMVELMEDLERQGATMRGRNPADRRAYAIELTPKGRALLERADREVADMEADFLAPLSEDERQELKRLLILLLVGEPAELVADAAVKVRAG
jgi:MarR family transcriptional regulator, lower aerobic nicotinate degradation pathway regulator